MRPPGAVTSRASRRRKRRACVGAGRSPTSSMRSVPPSASKSRPLRRRRSPAGAASPTRSSSSACGLAAVAATRTRGRWRRGDRACSVSATSVLPEPTSPTSRSGARAEATRESDALRFCIAIDAPTRRPSGSSSPEAGGAAETPAPPRSPNAASLRSACTNPTAAAACEAKSRSAGSASVSAGTTSSPTGSAAWRGTGNTFRRAPPSRTSDGPDSPRASASVRLESFGSVPFQTAAIASPSFAGCSEMNARLWSGVADATYVTSS